MSRAFEVNFDGLVGPTHSYAGLSFGNLASTRHKAEVSRPKEAALQGLRKMKFLADAGLKQAVLPPQERPDLRFLRGLGFSGSDAQVIETCFKAAPEILSAACSASSMWTANAATVSPSADTADGRVHFTVANLAHKLHRSIEHETTGRALRAIFAQDRFFAHHPALPGGSAFGDEGAANHTRLCEKYGKKGLELFVYGRSYFGRAPYPEPWKFPARQTLEASQSVARRHGLDPETVIFAQQNPGAIEAGAFHNDVVSLGNQRTFFYHGFAFLDRASLIGEMKAKFSSLSAQGLLAIEVSAEAVSLEDAIQSYLFNSQLVTLPNGAQALLAPQECESNGKVRAYIESLLSQAGSPIQRVHYFDLRQSMQNGGGPACLRLRVALKEEEIHAANAGVFLDEALYSRLTSWVLKHYRDQIAPADLRDPALLEECRQALDELTRILGLGAIYPFQLSA